MEKAIKMNTVLNEEQLDIVNGGAAPFAAGAVIAALTTVAKSWDNTAKELRNLVHSFEYEKMSNFGKEKAIGKILANSVGFSAACTGSITPAGMAAMQVKYRTVGVCATVREFVEKKF
ncbi:class IIb bacteriocin, lactobin A/cerein 7B family [Selenomonas sp. KH1T6]|uniref:class IIb bacteriocin, lactobin A/cerein 7B family n=2 Tax=Selenomonas sp. KH1T6 TaxID=3158784 RepID=UPI0008A7F984|nr:class IIb bacteriocin, lactobin A/cerein 7B family [Selenomonas ruminantium]